MTAKRHIIVLITLIYLAKTKVDLANSAILILPTFVIKQSTK